MRAPLKPFKPVKPGDFLQEELEARGWSQADLAAILQRPVQAVNEIITGKKAITAETAISLSAALKISPSCWLNWESAYRLDQVTYKEADMTAVQHRAQLYNVAPVADMIKRGWIKVDQPNKNLDELERALCRYYRVRGRKELLNMEMPACVARKSEGGNLNSAQLAWVTMVKHQAEKTKCSSFDPDRLIALAKKLPQFSATSEQILKIPAALQEAGVCLVLVETFPRSKIDGIALWHENNPVIGMSLRMKRIDYFFFTLLHEVVHILNGDVKAGKKPLLDVNILEPDSDVERRTNEQAKDLLIKSQEYRAFLARYKGHISRASVEQFASKLGIHPAILIGRLHFDEHLPYSHLRPMLGDVRSVFEKVIVR